ncbi:MAG: hypothetical protein QF681_02660 [Vicinamibacterales bacterium]|jgi:hypothetical protein|nr:hypothetical protein [Vicinamibacterales bacterium]
MKLRSMLIAATVMVLVGAQAALVGQTTLPTLRIDAPASLETVAERVGRYAGARLSTAMSLAGLTHAGLPIDVLLIDEGADLARSTPEWISGFADARRNLVVLFPNRAVSYPSDSLETLLHHEVAHILFSRAAQGRPVPRWFDEGLAMAAERPVGIGDRSRLAWTLVRHGGVSLPELERLFGEGRTGNQRAYAVSNALVRDLLRVHGEARVGRVLSLVGRGLPFDEAFETATGEPLPAAVARFWSGQRLWERWIPFLTQPVFLWMAITLLALLAIRTHRLRRREQRRLWEEEEQADAEREARERGEDRDREIPDSPYQVH